MEDAIWEFIRLKKIPKGSVFLFPDFYCLDVLQNIQRHGFIYKLWKVDKDFNTDIKKFTEYIAKYKPKIIFIFHSAGITSNVLHDKSWMSVLPQDCFIIEDSVHRVVDPSQVSLFHKNHIIMDSLRKVLPLPGSFMYGSPDTISYSQKPYRLSRYVLSSTALYAMFSFILQIGCVLNSAFITDFAYKKILQLHDDIIGDSWESYPGLPWIPFIHSFIDFEKIRKLKKRQVLVYKKFMTKLYKNKTNFYEIKIPESEYKNMHVYPVGLYIPEKQTDRLIQYLHNHNISAWIKFPGCEWNKDRSCLFLPLGFHVSDAEIQYAADTLLRFTAIQK